MRNLQIRKIKEKRKRVVEVLLPAFLSVSVVILVCFLVCIVWFNLRSIYHTIVQGLGGGIVSGLAAAIFIYYGGLFVVAQGVVYAMGRCSPWVDPVIEFLFRLPVFLIRTAAEMIVVNYLAGMVIIIGYFLSFLWFDLRKLPVWRRLKSRL